jgi:hypothetical protein
LEGLSRRFAKLEKLDRSLSLFEIGDGVATIYVRYSKLHAGGRRTFYGLRRDDLRRLGVLRDFKRYLKWSIRHPFTLAYFGSTTCIWRHRTQQRGIRLSLKNRDEPSSRDSFDVLRSSRAVSSRYARSWIIKASILGFIDWLNQEVTQ